MEPSMSDSLANDVEKAIQELLHEIRQERVPERILAVSRKLQADLAALDAKPHGSRTD